MAWNQPELVADAVDPFAATGAWQVSAQQVWGATQFVILRRNGDNQLTLVLKAQASGGYCLEPLETIWRYGPCILGDDAPGQLEELLWELSLKIGRLPRLISLSGLSHQTLSMWRLKDFLEGWFEPSELLVSRHCAASLERGVDGFLANRSANFRRNLRKQQRKARRSEIKIVHTIPTTSEEAEQLFARMIDVEQRSWKGMARVGMDSSMPRRLYGAMLRRLAELGRARVGFALHEGRDIGFIFGGVVGAIYRGQQFSYDKTWADYSVGSLLQFDQIVRLTEEGVTRYDLGPLEGRRMSYKAHWAEMAVPLLQCTLKAV